MSEADVPRRMRLVAVGAAVVAVLFTLVAVIVVLTRDGAHGKPTAQPESTLRDRVVRASDVVRLRRDVEVVVDAGQAKGLRVKDGELARALGLEPDDIITAMSGKPTLSDRDAYDVILKLSLMSVTVLYVDIARQDKPLLLRWKLDGDLRQARHGTSGTSGVGSLSGTGTGTTGIGGLGIGGLGSGSSAPPDPDPVLDAIEKVDDYHYKIPRKTVDALLNDPMLYSKGARVVPSIRNGQTNGLKLYAIRSSSLYARVGFANGDTVHEVNGLALDTPDKALEVYSKVRDADVLTFELTRRGQPVTLIIQITK